MEDENKSVDADTKPASEVKTLTQAEVDAIVGREKAAVADKVRRELETKHAAELERMQSSANQGLGGMAQGVDEDKIYNNVNARLKAEAEKAEQDRAADEHEAKMRELSQNYFSKLEKGGEKHNDFDEIMGKFKHHAFPQIVYLVSGKENAADIMYELAKNPQKLAVIDMWANKDPERAAAELDKLSESISQNETAQQQYQPTNPPLSQIKQSNAGMKPGSMSLEDFKSAEWNRF